MPDKQQQKKTNVNYMEVGRGSQLIYCVREAKDHMNQNWNWIPSISQSMRLWTPANVPLGTERNRCTIMVIF